MYQLVTKKGSRYWLTKDEVIGIRKLLAQNVPFITMKRYDKTINTFDIQELGIPDFLYGKLKAGYKIQFTSDGMPVIIGKDFIMEYDRNSWTTYENLKTSKTFLSFEEFIGDIKRLN